MGTDVLQRWISDPYLSDRRIQSIVESVAAKPVAKYVVLDDFFRPETYERLRESCLRSAFTKKQIERFDSHYEKLEEVDLELFSDPEWHRYCANLVGVKTPLLHKQSTNFHRHPVDSTGFWIHRDDVTDQRTIAVIGYFNHDWKSSNGGLLRVWREDEALASNLKPIDVNRIRESPQLFQDKRVRCSFFGVGDRDYTLVDQVVPEANRLFICNLQGANFWHSVTPSRERERYSFIQWIA